MSHEILLQMNERQALLAGLRGKPDSAVREVLLRELRDKPQFIEMEVDRAAVNVDARESNLSVSSMPDKRPDGVSVVRAGESFRSELREAKEGREVYAAFLVLAIAALVAESILGRKA